MWSAREREAIIRRRTSRIRAALAGELEKKKKKGTGVQRREEKEICSSCGNSYRIKKKNNTIASLTK